MRGWLRIPLQLAALGLLAAIVLTAVVTGAYYYVEPTLARAEELNDIRFQTPLRIYSVDGRYMQQYGEQKRVPADFEEIPVVLRNAVIAAEDDRFYQHNGIDLISTLRAVFNLGLQLVTGSEDRVPGGSTITQQVTRTTEILPRDYFIGRKIVEIFLALEIEKRFTKDKILRLYLNTYFFGQRSYGVVTAAQTYFDKELDQLSLSEAAVIAGIPTAPSRNNPYTSPENAERRRAYVLRRMHELGYISSDEREAALAEPVVPALHDVAVELEGGYVAAMAYEECQRRLSKAVCDEDGLRITTTVDSRLQQAANRELRNVLEAYDRNHGYRGPLGRIDLAGLGLGAGEAADDGDDGDDLDHLASATSPAEALGTLLADYPTRYGAEAAVVLEVSDDFADVFLRDTGRVTIGFDAVDWARPWLSDDRQGAFPDVVGDVLAAGDIVRFRRLADGRFELAQVPEAGRDDYVQGALVSIDPRSGAVVALAGGYDFSHSNYNRATQAEGRQPGSAFKPFFYLSALDAGYTLSTIVNDAAVCFYDETLEREHCPQNYGGRFFGETRLREVLINSLNASAYRVISDIGYSHAARYVERFGFDPEPRERNSSIALGSLGVSPLELANGYAILANGGYAVGIADPDSGRVEPYFVHRIENEQGEVLYDADRSVRTVCPEAPTGSGSAARLVERQAQLYPRFRCAERVESAQRIHLITSVLKDVVRRGSGARAYRAMPRSDIAGKTGTTNGPKDVWFAGFTPDIAAAVRVGFDNDERDLGDGEQGGVTAIPAWIGFMQAALEGQPERSLPQPPGIIERRIDPETGLIAADCRPNTEIIREFYLIENQPRRESDDGCFSAGPSAADPEIPGSSGNEELFD